MTHPDFWNDQQKAQTVINEANALKESVNQLAEMTEAYENLDFTYELVKEESDEELQAELEEEITSSCAKNE